MNPLFLAIAVFLGVFAAVSVSLLKLQSRRQLSLLAAQLAAYRQGHYEEQLRIIEGFRVNGSEPPNYLFFRGAACHQLGWLQQAERALRRSLDLETNPVLKTVCRNELGRVLMSAERWDEAEACFQKCIEEMPKRAGGYRALAEMLLRRGGAPQEALVQARSAVAADRAEKVLGKAGREVNVLNLSESLAVLAWALADNQAKPGEISRALDEAFALCPPTTKPVAAELHYFAGRAWAALGETPQSNGHLQQAAEIDPAGNYGRLSQALTAVPSGT